jgi:mRNA interferase MazF
MSAQVNLSVSISETLFNQLHTLAGYLNVSTEHLIELAIQQFIETQQATKAKASIVKSPGIIKQGDIYWVQLESSDGLEPGIPHPHVVIQPDILNQSRIDTIVVCAITSNLKRASLPGNILLDAGEGNLPKQSVIEVSKVSTMNKTELGEYIGSLSEGRVHQIFAGMGFLQRAFLPLGS